MEPISAIAKAAGKEAAGVLKKESESFLNAALGEPAKALGGLFADRISARRHANLIRIAVDAKRKLADAGVSPKEVPLSVIHPALEAASLEEEPNMQETWANLLANAADPRNKNAFPPVFPAILRELSHREVMLLDAIYQMDAPTNVSNQMGVDSLMLLYDKIGLSTRTKNIGSATERDWRRRPRAYQADLHEYRVTLDVLMRNQVLYEEMYSVPREDIYSLPRKQPLDRTYRLSGLGKAFIAMCQAPTKSSE